jgi:hypothetical protein
MTSTRSLPEAALDTTETRNRDLPMASASIKSDGVPGTLARIAPAIGLFFLSPLVGEFLLGNVAIDALPALAVLAPLYGGGAVLIREVTRRTGRGWPTIVLLALAFAIFEEGLVTQSLFNPGYAGADLLSVTPVPAMGIGVWWTHFVLTLHTVWSICVPIAIVEALVPERSTVPWLGNIGLGVSVVMLALGSLATFFGSYFVAGFIATQGQLLGAAVAVVVFVVAAFTLTGHLKRPACGAAPDPRLVGFVSFIVASLFLGATMFMETLTGGVVVLIYQILYGSTLGIILSWSRRAGWSSLHVLALAGGALLAYAWHAFPQWPALGSPGQIDLIGNIIFAAGAVALLAAAISVQRSSRPNAEA